MPHRPVIGLNMSLEMGNKYTGYDLRVPLNYVDAIISAGGIPFACRLLKMMSWRHRSCHVLTVSSLLAATIIGPITMEGTRNLQVS